MDTIYIYLIILASIGVGILIFTLIRMIILWYYKINDRVILLENILEELKLGESEETEKIELLKNIYKELQKLTKNDEKKEENNKSI